MLHKPLWTMSLYVCHAKLDSFFKIKVVLLLAFKWLNTAVNIKMDFAPSASKIISSWTTHVSSNRLNAYKLTPVESASNALKVTMLKKVFAAKLLFYWFVLMISTEILMVFVCKEQLPTVEIMILCQDSALTANKISSSINPYNAFHKQLLVPKILRLWNILSKTESV